MPEVIVYTTPFCGPCEQLKRFLAAEGIAFKVRDLMMDEAAAERLAAHGIRGTPTLEVDGRFLTGDALTPDSLREALFA